ncbi:MAG: hypothetical protein Q8O08_10050 [Methyloversatilis sp.]|uniref:hypothetical protein n=1 Tax=Methyloversatilis sp. TaxID=2569862 RepID=UPI002734AF59|nr:hypothetical protein [Methyloversatilis sp.]MDP2869160.1 hypothetical protein [Methyloversatilis sp.]MDP3288447.1 hypothetical protein [Methyloversatilis sp.]
MNAPDERRDILAETEEEGRFAFLRRFRVEDIHTLGRDDLLAAQSLAGHGNTWGFWQTPEAYARMPKHRADIDLTGRLSHFLSKEAITSNVDLLVDEGVLVLMRWALLVRMVPSAKFKRSCARLKCSSLAVNLYAYLPRLAARAIVRKLAAPDVKGFFSFLMESDQREFAAIREMRVEMERLNTLQARGLWNDVPVKFDNGRTTDPSQEPSRPAQDKNEPYLPLPDSWLAEIGPRVLWVVQDLGPNLLHLLETLREEMRAIDWSLSKPAISRNTGALIASHLATNRWLDRAGRPLTPSFPLRTCAGKHGANTKEWPPRTWEQVAKLSVVLQGAHLFIVLLACAGRIGEVATLTRACVGIARDGNDYLSGRTYKLSSHLFGDSRQWPAPPILCQVLGQQGRLAAAWDWLPCPLEDGLPDAPRFGADLWVSIGKGNAGEGAMVDFNGALRSLSERLGIEDRPGGRLVHAHRFRKTMGRLAGVALFNSPLILKRLFGHKSIEMTLHYILCDEGVREEAEKVLRELRVMHCAEALEEIHHAIANNLPLPDNGGAGAARLAAAVRHTEAELAQGGRGWRESSAYDLACLLTMQGQGWRLIKENIVCSKAPGEDGLCQKKRTKGEPDTANCQPQCDNRIVFARKRRDVQLGIEQYLDMARQARDDDQLLVLASVMDNMQDEWTNFADLEKQYRADPEVQALLALCEEPEFVGEAT